MFNFKDSGPEISQTFVSILSKEELLFLSEVGGSGGDPTEGEQGGATPAAAGPPCEPRKGQREALEAKSQQVLLHESYILL